MLKKIILILLFNSVLFADTADNYAPVQYDCDGSTKAFTFSWPVGATSEVEVVLKLTSTEVETVLETTHYAVSATNNDYSSGGTVTTVDTYANTYTLTIRRDTAKTQDATIVDTRTLRLAAIQDGLDKLTRLIQDLFEEVGRCLKIPKTETTDVEIESEINRAGMFLYCNDDGELTFAAGVTVGDVVVSSYMEGVVGSADAAAARTNLGAVTDADVIKKDGSVAYTDTGDGFKDEDSMTSDSATATASQQSIKSFTTIQGRLYQAGSAQDIPDDTETQLTYDTADSSNHSSAGASAAQNYLKPTVAGVYYVFLTAGTTEDLNNGTIFKIIIKDKDANIIGETRTVIGSTGDLRTNCICLEYFDGTNDYVKAYIYHNHGEARKTTNDVIHSFGLFKAG